MPIQPTYLFYDSLISLAELRNNTLIKIKSESAEFNSVNDNLKLLQRHAADDAATLYLTDLLNAEAQRTVNRKLQAISYYDLAITGAKNNNDLQHVALINELAGGFYMEWGKDNFAAIHIKEAINCYRAFGADAKVDRLLKHRPELYQGELQATVFNSIHPVYKGSEVNYRQLVEDIADVIWPSDSDRRYIYLSPQFQTQFGLARMTG